MTPPSGSGVGGYCDSNSYCSLDPDRLKNAKLKIVLILELIQLQIIKQFNQVVCVSNEWNSTDPFLQRRWRGRAIASSCRSNFKRR